MHRSRSARASATTSAARALLVAAVLASLPSGVAYAAPSGVAYAAPAGPVPSARSAALPSQAPATRQADWTKGQWWIDATKLRQRHAQGITGKGVTIALVDGPVNTAIPELKGRDVRPTWSACGDRWKKAGPLTADGPLDETSFHTTSMAALLVGSGVGTGPGGAGILGVAPDATLRTYAVFNTTDRSYGQNLMCDLKQMPAMIDRIVADGADVVLVPLTLPANSGEFRAALNRAINRGVIVVSGGGNNGPSTPPMPPGDLPGVLVVGGIDRDAKILPHSPTSLTHSWEEAQLVAPGAGGDDIHLVAPASDILGGGLQGGVWDSDVLQSGTSGASAIVVGQLALMKQRWPKATSNQLLYSLLRLANRRPGAVVWEPRGGFGTSSFESTLTVDPTVLPDVHPFYASLADVMSDHPVKPFIPEAVDGNGSLLKAPVPSVTSPSTARTKAPDPAAAPVTTPVTAAAVAGSSGGSNGSGGTGVLVPAGIGALVLLGAGGWLLRSRGRSGVHVDVVSPVQGREDR